LDHCFKSKVHVKKNAESPSKFFSKVLTQSKNPPWSPTADAPPKPQLATKEKIALSVHIVTYPQNRTPRRHTGAKSERPVSITSWEDGPFSLARGREKKTTQNRRPIEWVLQKTDFLPPSSLGHNRAACPHHSMDRSRGGGHLMPS